MTDHGYGIAPNGFRLPAETTVGGVRLLVSSLERSTAFYETVLGLQVAERAGDRVTLSPQGARRPLIQLETAAGVVPSPRRGTLGLYHFALLLPDRGSLGRLLTHLSAIGVPAGMSDHVVSEAVYLSDPDGLGIEVYADRPRSTWRASGRQLVMATNPLDAAAVVRAADGAPWTGMPAGTVVGHVHLHVGDLARAEAFYHAALGFDKVVWGYPGALFLSAGGYHHHLGTNTWSAGGPPASNQARLLSWDLIVPAGEDARAAAGSLERAGYAVEPIFGGWTAADPWGTRLRLLSASGDTDSRRTPHVNRPTDSSRS
jgi:catechol 2,3-dioxygenase